MQAFLNFLSYMGTAVVLLAAFMFIYEKVTPYREFREIKDNNNIAAAISFGAAIIGFTFPLISAIFYTHSLVEMAKWAAVTGVVQLVLFLVMHRFTGCGNCIRENKVAPAVLLAFMSIAVGMLNAICISY